MNTATKRIIALLTIFVMLFSFSACNKKEENNNNTTNTVTVTNEAGEIIDTPANSSEETTVVAENGTTAIVAIDNGTTAVVSNTTTKASGSTSISNASGQTTAGTGQTTAGTGQTTKATGQTTKGTATTTKASTTTTKKPTTTTTTAAPTDENDTKRKSLESTYGIKIYYGNENSDYFFCGHSVTRLTDSATIKKSLGYLEDALKLYPSGFFKEFKNYGLPITIMLIDQMDNGAVSGLTDSGMAGKIVISLNYDMFMDYTFNHEMMHAIDKYIDCKNNGGIEPLLNEYAAFNPNDFYYYYYSNSNSSPWNEHSYVFKYNTAGPHYFISLYATTRVTEDRAETFKYMMRSTDNLGMFGTGNEAIKSKGQLISKQIKKYFTSASGTCKWDKHLS